MTKDNVIDVVHKTIYEFFDVVADDSEEPISENDKLLLEVNKAICNAIKEMTDEEQKTGRWEIEPKHPMDSSTFAHIKCTECGERPFGDFPTLYCPHCGANMKGTDNG